MKNIIKKIGVFVAVLIVVMLLTNIIGRYILNVNPVITISNNMFPTYEKYDSLFYVPSESYNINDVIVASVPNYDTLLITRIIKINEDGSFDAKGDNNPEDVPLIEKSINKNQILGKIAFSIKPYFYFPLIYGIQLIVAFLLTKLIFRKEIKNSIKTSNSNK